MISGLWEEGGGRQSTEQADLTSSSGSRFEAALKSSAKTGSRCFRSNAASEGGGGCRWRCSHPEMAMWGAVAHVDGTQGCARRGGEAWPARGRSAASRRVLCQNHLSGVCFVEDYGCFEARGLGRDALRGPTSLALGHRSRRPTPAKVLESTVPAWLTLSSLPRRPTLLFVTEAAHEE